ncbi:hypothetical protein LIA77_04910 [Sarocladium implicatum]|nr:hypothetical protein LIA77_04910 [Sarocladium implicatum]
MPLSPPLEASFCIVFNSGEAVVDRSRNTTSNASCATDQSWTMEDLDSSSLDPFSEQCGSVDQDPCLLDDAHLTK